MPPSVVVAAVQAAPIYLNLERSLARALDLIAEAAKRKAQLVVFPEAWLTGYPAWMGTCRDSPTWDNIQARRLYAQLLENSVTVQDRVTATLGDAARRYKMTLVMGVHERVSEGGGRGTLYNSILTFGANGELMNHHRKLMPAFNERILWGQGNAGGLRVVETQIGRIGGLICWEHWMPLVRQTLHLGGEDIHVALWPSVNEMYQIASRHYAYEGRCFVVAAGAIMRRADLPRDFELAPHLAGDESEFILDGGSAVIGPDGHYVAGPAFGSEVIILARINLERIREESMQLDMTGHFNRPDLFDFRLKGQVVRGAGERIGVSAENGFNLPEGQGAEVVLPQRNEQILAASGTDAAPAFRVITSRPTGYDPERREIENKR
jgi:nitrilase